LDGIFSKRVYAAKFQLGESCPWWSKEEKQEMSSAARPVICQHYIICSWPLFLYCFDPCILLKSPVFALSIFQEPELALGLHLSGIFPSSLRHYFVFVLNYMPIIFSQKNNIIPLVFCLVTSSTPLNEASSL
jgi:hypothetical protein